MPSTPRLTLRRAAVLGAGVMGAQIAAHLANADLPVLLFDLPAPEGPPNAIVQKALDGLNKLDPAPLADGSRLAHIEPANYEQHLARLAECDLVIEAVAERADIKDSLYRRIAPHLKPGAVLASNTSGLSINGLAAALPAEHRPRFCGVHFFNPPRYMSLVELIPTADTDPALLDALESWLTSRLGKGVVRAKDTPNFIANRVGVFAVLATLQHGVRLGLGFDEIDALTGPLIGRPKSATCRTADVVGLDTLAHVVHTMQAQLADDPWHPHFHTPAWLAALIAQGALGQKTRAGIYRKNGRQIEVLDLATQAYRPAGDPQQLVAPEVAAILAQRDPAARFAALRASEHPQARFLWVIHRDVFHYCACHLATLADNARDVDLALRRGFGWALGPFELWQAAGWRAVAEAIGADLAAGQTLAATPLPAWVGERAGVHEAAGSWSANLARLQPRSSLPVYQRQLYPETLLGEAPAERGHTVWENEGVRLWTHPTAPTVAILSFTSKMHTIGSEVLDGIHEAIARAEADYDALVLWHDAPFSFGANLKQVAEACAAGQFDALEATVARFQQTALALRYAQVPTVAAVQGIAFGGGCEFALHTHHRVLALESYVGLVEVGVGLIPAGGGSKEFALRAARHGAQQAGGELFPFLQQAFERLARGAASRSALEAIELGFALPGDDVVFNPHELLHVALHRARALAANHRPPLPPKNIPVAGRTGIANCEMMLVNMAEGGFISAHDVVVSRALATALCGGVIDPGSRVDEAWLLAVERQQFIALLKTPETQARIRHMLETGKPLRN